MGSIYEKIESLPDRLYNTSVLISKKGEITAVYRKIHLCDIDSPALYNLESGTIEPGNEVVVTKENGVNIGLSICYDIRFPCLYETLRAKGAEVIFVPAAFFLHTGKHHWFPLLQARAIENQVYIAAPAQWGQHPKNRMSYGHSILIDPWGTVVCCAPEKPCVITGVADLDYLHNIRENMPVIQHRRSDCYLKQHKLL